jgi:hypothetical protein
MFDVSSDTPEGGRFPDEGTDSNTNDVFDAFPQEGPMLIPDSGLEAGHD